MWPFKSEKQRAIEQFSRMVSPEVMEKILSAPENLELPAPRKMRWAYAMIQIEEGINDDELLRRINAICTWAETRNSDVQIASPFVFITFIQHEPNATETDSTCEKIEAELAQFGNSLKAVCGIGNGFFGLWGGKNRADYSVKFPHFGHWRIKLSEIDYGTIHRIDDAE